MTVSAVRILLALLLLTGCAGLPGGPGGDPAPRLRLDLEARPPWVEPGGETLLLARFHIPRGWHLYWMNPGDSGLPPELAWTLPEGWTAGGPHFPVPREHVSEAGRSWIHEGELVLRIPLRCPAGAVPGEAAAIQVEADWLACREACVPGRSRASLVVEVVEEGKEPRPGDPAADLPRPWTGPPWEAFLAAGRLDLACPGWAEAPLRGWFLPEEGGWLDESAGRWSRSPAVRWEQPLSAWGGEPPDTLRGLLLDLDRPGRGWSLELPLLRTNTVNP